MPAPDSRPSAITDDAPTGAKSQSCINAVTSLRTIGGAALALLDDTQSTGLLKTLRLSPV